jgi:hypothetical protein
MDDDLMQIIEIWQGFTDEQKKAALIRLRQMRDCGTSQLYWAAQTGG